MHYGQILYADSANGIGIRVSLFVSGCTNHCPGCFQPETWDFLFGEDFNQRVEDKVVEELKKPYYDGLTILGGEPMELANQEGILSLLRRVKNELHKSVWIYTGFVYEDLLEGGKRHGPHTEEILSLIDVLVDGRFEERLKDITLRFRGSSNQRVIDMAETRKQGHLVLSPYSHR